MPDSFQDLLAARDELAEVLLRAGVRGGVVGRRPALSVAEASAAAASSVHAVGIGRKLVNGKPTGDLCVRVYTSHKLPEHLLAPVARIPASVAGVPTDIIQERPAYFLAHKNSKSSGSRKPSKRPVASVRAASDTPAPCSSQRKSRLRPIIGGISGAHPDVMTGTLGTFCRSMLSGEENFLFLLSNNHVLANTDRGLPGDAIYQPSVADFGTRSETIARLDRVVQLVLGGTVPNQVDAAIARVDPGIATDLEICSIGAVNRTVAPALGMLVQKHGRTTGLTRGRIDDIGYHAVVGVDPNDPGLMVLLTDQIRIQPEDASEPFSDGGDSGALVVAADSREAVGLLCAGPSDQSYAVANQIDRVLAALNIVLA